MPMSRPGQGVETEGHGGVVRKFSNNTRQGLFPNRGSGLNILPMEHFHGGARKPMMRSACPFVKDEFEERSPSQSSGGRRTANYTYQACGSAFV